MAITKVINELIDLNATDATKSLKMPKGAAYSGATEDGMIRNSSETGSQGSANVMQHFNGTDWKNYENVAAAALTTEYLVVAGGGSGGSNSNSGGAGAGGYRTNFGGTKVPLSLGTPYDVTVGAGGTATAFAVGANGNNGNNSVFNAITSTGGGRGSAQGGSSSSGGSGGGGAYDTAGASGNSGSFFPVEGYAGGAGVSAGSYPGGGGGGASEAGNTDGNGSGGDGESNSITGTAVTYAGGGSAGVSAGTAVIPGSDGGGGAGGAGDPPTGTAATAGIFNTGGGGGGGSAGTGGGAGGAGTVILRYPTASVGTPGYIVTGTLDTVADTAYPTGTTNTAYYKLEGGSGTTVTDSSGNGNNGVSTSVTYAAGRFGQAAVFNGTSSFVALPFFNFVSGSSANFTASLWFNVTDMSGTNNLIQLSGSSSTNSSFNVQLLSNGTFRIDSYGVGHAFSGLPTVSTNNWYNLVLVNAGGTCTPYLNGSAGNVLTHSISFSGSYSNLGARYVLGSLYTLDITTGQIDQVRIFNSVISAGNVTSLYNESTVIPSTDGTDSILQFINGTGTVTFS